MNDLRKTRVVVYSAIVGKIAFADMDLPALVLCTTFGYGGTILCVEGFVYDIEEQMHGVSCGTFARVELGELDGSVACYPYGHIPAETFEDIFYSPQWEVNSDKKWGCLASRPIQVCRLPEFEDSTFTVSLL